MASVPNGYVWGPINAEDLVQVPGTDWVVTSGMIGPGAAQGRLYMVDSRDLSCSELFPYRLAHALDAARFGEQPLLDPEAFQPHGIDIRLNDKGLAELFVVNHGGRESVEVFEIVFDDVRPSLTWIGGVEMPGTTLGNDLAAVAGGGFVIATTGDIAGGPQGSMEEMMAAVETGGALEWSTEAGWRLLPRTGINVANGIAVSSDGEWVFIAGWRGQCVKKVRRGVPDPEAVEVPAGIMVDNLTWTRDGKLLAAGAYDTTMEDFIASHFGGGSRMAAPTRVIRIDPENLAIDIVVDYGGEAFGVGTTGLEVGDEIWVGAARDQGLARFLFPSPNPDPGDR